MKERGMLFSAPMIKALLNGTKTQTRRLRGLDEINQEPDSWRYDGEIRPQIHQFINLVTGEVREIKCPYGVAGDVLYARETFSAKHGVVEYRADRTPKVDDKFPWSHIYDEKTRWTPGIHMPKACSRIKREITEMRVPRLNSISEADAIAEGTILPVSTDGCPKGKAVPLLCISKTVEGHPLWGKPKYNATIAEYWTGWYALLWEEINGKGSWKKNPHVWALSLRSAK